ncbi:CBL-interacting serine/threonine-protein kinase 23 [Diplonema papillatum]|nr:CBL-interacting serine/threonine-protein kinase 23 [Diplonema papillatum]
MGDDGEYQTVSFKVPLLRREKELTFKVGKTVAEMEGCIKIKQAHDEMGSKYFVKLIRRDAMDKLPAKAAVMNRINKDLGMLKLIDHVNITKMFQIFSSIDCVYVLLEYTPQMFDRYLEGQKDGRVSESKAKHFFKQLVSGVEYLHDRALCHRNLCIRNIQMDESEEMLKISGFSASCLQSSKDVLYDHPIVEPLYQSPEMEGNDSYHGKKTDIWSLGCLLYRMLTGKEYRQVYKKVNPVPQLEEIEGEVVRALLRRLLDPDWRARINLLDLMVSDWLQIQNVGQRRNLLVERHGSVEDLEAFTTSELQQNFKKIGKGFGLAVDVGGDSPDLIDDSFSPLAGNIHDRDFTILDTPADHNLSPTWDSAHPRRRAPLPTAFELSPQGASPASKLKKQLTVDILQTGGTMTDTKFDHSPMHAMQS